MRCRARTCLRTTFVYRFTNELSWLSKEIVDIRDVNKFALFFIADLNFPLIFFEYGFDFWLNIFRVRYNYGAYFSWWSIKLLMIEIVAYTINLSTVTEFKLCLASEEATIKIRSNSTYYDVLGLKLNLVHQNNLTSLRFLSWWLFRKFVSQSENSICSPALGPKILKYILFYQ